MPPASKYARSAFRAIGPGVLLAMSIGLSGCAIYDDDGVAPDLFCGHLYDCGSHGENDPGGPPDIRDPGRGPSPGGPSVPN